MNFILGKKIGMTQLFTKEGQFVPVTLIECGPCYVLQKKSKEIRTKTNVGGTIENKKDGYEAIQIGFGKLKESKIKKTQKQKPYGSIKEFKGEIDISKYKEGDEINASIFKEGDIINISGISKGKGFQGAVKMWGFAGKFATHGVKHEHRVIGSVGCRFPQRVILGKKMPGRMGGERTTVKNLKIMKVELENNLIAVRGAVPGIKGTLLEIKG